MSRYERKTWTTDDYVTPTPMNNIETGVLEAVEPLMACRDYNLLSQPYYHGTSRTVSDAAYYNVGGNGAVHLRCNGSSSGATQFWIVNNLSIDEDETYTLWGCNDTGSSSTFGLTARVYDSDDNVTLYRDYGEGVSFTGGVKVRVYCWVYGDVVADAVITPTLIKGSSPAFGMNACDFAAKIWRSIQGY